MNGTGARIGKALRRFTKAVFPLIFDAVECNGVTTKDVEVCLWFHGGYDNVIKALMDTSEFETKKEADIYLCGYYRGLQMAVFLTKTEPEEN
jgi:hypothetical protein